MNGQSTINGLFAIGEVASVGIHGANRLASNALLEGLVFGSRAATLINEKFQTSAGTSVDDYGVKKVDEFVDYSDQIEAVRSIMWKYVGLIRSESSLQSAREEINKIVSDTNMSLLAPQVSELKHMVGLANIMIDMCLARKESRGAHFREDFKQMSQEYERHSSYSLTL